MLNYFKILPFLIKIIGWIINKITHMGQLESYIAISTSMLGQPEVYLTVKNIIQACQRKVIYYRYFRYECCQYGYARLIYANDRS